MNVCLESRFYISIVIENDLRIVIYPTRSLEQQQTHPDRALLESEQFHRVYLDELGDIQVLPLDVALMALTSVSEESAPGVARAIIGRVKQEESSPPVIRRIMEMVTKIMVYKFTNLSRQDVAATVWRVVSECR
jgi:predicted transposase YdaD